MNILCLISLSVKKIIEKIEIRKVRVKINFFKFKFKRNIPVRNNIKSPNAVLSPVTKIEQENKTINRINLFLPRYKINNEEISGNKRIIKFPSLSSS